MKINSMPGLALLFAVVGCSSVRTSSLHCAPLSRKEQEFVYSDLNRMLVTNGFSASTHEQTPWGTAWGNADSFSSLWKGRADFQVGESTNSTGMEIDVFYYRGGASANKALVDAIIACLRRDAPSAVVKVKSRTTLGPLCFGE